MPRIIFEYKDDSNPSEKKINRYAIWCKVLPPPSEGGKGSILIPNVEIRHKPRIRGILEDLHKIFNIDQLLETSDLPWDKIQIQNLLESEAGRYKILLKVVNLMDKDTFISKLKTYFGDKISIEEILQLKEAIFKPSYDYVAIPRVGVDYKEKFNEIVIELKEDPEIKGVLCLPLNGGDLKKELTIKVKN